MITTVHSQVDRCLATAHSLSFGDEVIAAFNSAKRLGGSVKVSNLDSQPVVHLSSQSPTNLTAVWWTLNQYIASESDVDDVFSVFSEMGLPVSAVDARMLAKRLVMPDDGFPF